MAATLARGLSGNAGQKTPATDDELHAWVRNAWGVNIPRVAVCANHVAPFTAFADAYFARSVVAVWEGSRGFSGKSFMLALLGLTIAATLGVDVNILGGSGEQSQRVHEYMTQFWDAPGAPRELLATDPTMRYTRLTTNAKIRALMASQRSVRGPHVARLLLDEIDEMDQAIFDAAMGQTMSQRGVLAHTVCSSTHQHADGTMTEALRRAADKGWAHFQWCYRESLEPHGWLTAADVARKRQEVPDEMWRAEYELHEPSIGDRAINTEAVERMWQADRGTYDGREHEYVEIEAPVGDAWYSTGADWARKQDYTVIVTMRLDTKPARLVAFERLQRRPWPDMVARFDGRLDRYRGVAYHDGTGLGDVVAGFMRHQARAVMMVGRDRADLLSRYIAAIEHDDLAAPMIRWPYAQHRYATVGDVYGTRSEDHLPDSISAMALAWQAVGRGWAIGMGNP